MNLGPLAPFPKDYIPPPPVFPSNTYSEGLGGKGLIAEVKDILASIRWFFGGSPSIKPVVHDFSHHETRFGLWKED